MGLASPDGTTVQSARELIRTAKYVEALETLRPIADDPERAAALDDGQRVVLYYALGRARQELNQACAARDAFDLALGQPQLEEPQRVRITDRREALRPALTGVLTVQCEGAAVVGNSPMPCGEPQTMRAGTHAVTISLSNGLAYPTEAVQVPACLETSFVARVPAQLRYLGPPAQVFVDGHRIDPGRRRGPGPAGARKVRVQADEKVLVERQVEFAQAPNRWSLPPVARWLSRAAAAIRPRFGWPRRSAA